MSAQLPISISSAVEGLVDEEVLRRLVEYVGAFPGPVHGKHGKQYLRQRLDGYNQAARFSPWVVLVDLNNDAHCAPPLRQAWLPRPAARMCFRVAVRAVEAWLLADRERIAGFLRVPVARIPVDPESVNDPKRFTVDLARHSVNRDIREDMVPRPGSGRAVGPAYTSRIIEFVSDRQVGWRPAVAARSANSLRRCLDCLRNLARLRQ